MESFRSSSEEQVDLQGWGEKDELTIEAGQTGVKLTILRQL